MRRFEMHTLREWIHRVSGTLHLGRRDSELEEELRLHQELADDDARRRGLAPDEAMREVNVRLGGASQALDAVRDQRGVPWVDDLVRDLRYAVRTFLRSPVF